ncbi:MAG: DUF393 domain-containing protein [Leptospiraceae bacterium]|nr:DUF393 domain-containing protein [Leptospiraceae bacterium]
MPAKDNREIRRKQDAGPGRTTETASPENSEQTEIAARLQEGPIVFFDGVCNICNHSVNTLLKLDRKGRLRYASLQGPLASHLFGPLQGDPDSVKLTVPNENQGRPQEQSFDSRGNRDNVATYEGYDAFVKIAGLLYPLLRPLAFFVALPPFRYMGSALYKWIARRRYRWFGKREFCDISNLKFKDRFLD